LIETVRLLYICRKHYTVLLTRGVPLVEQELLILPEHPSSSPVFSGVRVTRSLVLCVCFVDRCLSFCPFSFWPLFCVLLQFTDSDYPFGIFKLLWLKYTIYKQDKTQCNFRKCKKECI